MKGQKGIRQQVIRDRCKWRGENSTARNGNWNSASLRPSQASMDQGADVRSWPHSWDVFLLFYGNTVIAQV